MGTSKSGEGITGDSPLLPAWAPPADHQEDGEPEGEGGNEVEETDSAADSAREYTVDFRAVKSAFTKYVKNPSQSSFKSAARKYIRSTGGIKNATTSAATGINVGRRYIGFLNNLQANGLQESLNELGLGAHIGKSSEEVLALVADSIAPVGSTNDEAIARDAILEATEKLYERLEEDQQDLSTLDTLDSTLMHVVITEYVSAYIFKKWVYEAGMALEANTLSQKDAIDLENQMKDFIREEVKEGIRAANINEFNLSTGRGRDLVVEIFELAYTTLEK